LFREKFRLLARPAPFAADTGAPDRSAAAAPIQRNPSLAAARVEHELTPDEQIRTLIGDWECNAKSWEGAAAKEEQQARNPKCSPERCDDHTGRRAVSRQTGHVSR